MDEYFNGFGSLYFVILKAMTITEEEKNGKKRCINFNLVVEFFILNKKTVTRFARIPCYNVLNQKSRIT